AARLRGVRPGAVPLRQPGDFSAATFGEYSTGTDNHHRISDKYLRRYAQEAAFREDRRRQSNGEQFKAVVTLVAANAPSVDFCGYWQRARKAA
ncbi:MAG TPA: hypothetical protein VEB64_12370, partial [Azospirillaceae bacterium]|nr:hypothetical protein [Azospirillaceae bacterium]